MSKWIRDKYLAKPIQTEVTHETIDEQIEKFFKEGGEVYHAEPGETGDKLTLFQLEKTRKKHPWKSTSRGQKSV